MGAKYSSKLVVQWRLLQLRLVRAVFELHEDLAFVAPATDVVRGASRGSTADGVQDRRFGALRLEEAVSASSLLMCSQIVVQSCGDTSGITILQPASASRALVVEALLENRSPGSARGRPPLLVGASTL
eukprot:scaffold5178_cov27-Tisochrysis_lutea.AAC.1